PHLRIGLCVDVACKSHAPNVECGTSAGGGRGLERVLGGVALPVASMTNIFAEGASTPLGLSVEESVGTLAGHNASSSSPPTSYPSTTLPLRAHSVSSSSSAQVHQSKHPPSTSLSTSPSNPSSRVASLGRSKPCSASSASKINRLRISQGALDRVPATRATDEEGDADGLPSMMRIMPDLFPGGISWSVCQAFGLGFR
ncbi:hypothetical protein DFP72DRAFT_1127504, partial [Ephemerocybe angulata]